MNRAGSRVANAVGAAVGWGAASTIPSGGPGVDDDGPGPPRSASCESLASLSGADLIDFSFGGDEVDDDDDDTPSRRRREVRRNSTEDRRSARVRDALASLDDVDDASAPAEFRRRVVRFDAPADGDGP